MPANLSTDSARKGYETSDVPFRPWLWFGLGFVVCLVVIYLGVWVFTKSLASPDTVIGRTQRDADKSLGQFPQPQLQVNPAADLQSYLSREETELTTYGWVDRKAGIVRVPIIQAIDSLVRQGIPVRPPNSGLTELDMQVQKAGGAKILPPASSQRQNP